MSIAAKHGQHRLPKVSSDLHEGLLQCLLQLSGEACAWEDQDNLYIKVSFELILML